MEAVRPASGYSLLMMMMIEESVSGRPKLQFGLMQFAGKEELYEQIRACDIIIYHIVDDAAVIDEAVWLASRKCLIVLRSSLTNNSTDDIRAVHLLISVSLSLSPSGCESLW